jgi:eukaryotic-like serine/threonine-protein kinase
VRLTPGTRVGPYEVVALLGAGGMAEVYRARDTRLGRDVAIKVVSEMLGTDRAFLERFDREAKLAASLSHPNVVALFDVGLQDGKPYFVTELLQGESLRERLGKGRIPLGNALEWAAQMAQGLAAAHERAIVHRDLKPENIFITLDGHVKLLDFGIAKLIETAQPSTPHGLMDPTVSPSGSSTRTGMLLGTPGFMSPEQVRGDPVDARTDFFSLGAVLYEMLSGQRAFPAGPVVETGYAVLHDDPEPLPATVPRQVAQVVYRCLEKDPARRFQTARDLAFNLELVRTPATSGATTASTLEAPERHLHWRPWLWPLAATLAALALAAMYFVERGRRLSAPTVKPITFRHGTVSAGRFAPDGRVVYSAAWGREPEEIFSTSPGSYDAQPLGVRSARLLCVLPQGELAVLLRQVWSGEYAFFGATVGTLALVPGVGGVPRALTEDIQSADCSPTGELAVVRYVNGKSQLEYPLGTPLFETTGSIGFPHVSPGGDVVALWHQPQDASPNQLLLVDRKGAIRQLVDVLIVTGVAWAPSGEEVWFTDSTAAIWANPVRGGRRRLVYQGISGLDLEDISRDGEILINVEDRRSEIAVVPPGQHRETELPWLKFDSLVALSEDGNRVLFTAFDTLNVNWSMRAYVRPTEGSPPLKLGAGTALAFSTDERWVLTLDYRNTSELWLVPIGVGVPKKLTAAGFTFSYATRLLRDGKRLVAIAERHGDKQWRLFLVPLEGGPPTPLSDAPVSQFFLEVSRDDRFAAVVSFDGTLTLFPLDGRAPIPLHDLRRFVVPAGWTADGQLWVYEMVSRDAPSRLLRYDIPSRRVVEERTITAADLDGLIAVGKVRITPDSRSIALEYYRSLGSLYVLDGLAPPRR